MFQPFISLVLLEIFFIFIFVFILFYFIHFMLPSLLIFVAFFLSPSAAPSHLLYSLPSSFIYFFILQNKSLLEMRN